jgi:hypothetical protein
MRKTKTVPASGALMLSPSTPAFSAAAHSPALNAHSNTERHHRFHECRWDRDHRHCHPGRYGDPLVPGLPT